jgi:hypothetical protein
VPTREIDDDRVHRRLEGGSLVVPEAQEEDVGAACQRFRVLDERGQRAVEAEVEGRRRLAGERVGAEGDDLELGM